jgi:uncharacterized protein DUF6794
MTITWSDRLNINTNPPATISEAIERLQDILSPDEKRYIAVMDENDLIDLHFSLGLEIRNAFGLHDVDSQLQADCKTTHPDDAAGVIVRKLWERLQP